MRKFLIGLFILLLVVAATSAGVVLFDVPTFAACHDFHGDDLNN